MIKVIIPEGLSNQELSDLVDEDLAEFEVYFKALGSDGLSRPEKAILRTWIWYKTHEGKHG